MKKYFFFLLIIIKAGFLMASKPKDSLTKTIYGFTEYVVLVDQNLVLEAKLDTGAKSASLNSVNIKKRTVNGQEMLDFDVPFETKLVHFSAPFLGYVSIKPRTNEFSFSTIKRLISFKRPLVELSMRLGDTTKKIRVNLTNRKHFNYPLLLGREAIVKFNGLIDPSKKNSIMRHDQQVSINPDLKTTYE